jgi:hypothetical protein
MKSGRFSRTEPMQHSILQPAGFTYFAGLDLGQSADPTALVVLGRRPGADGNATYQIQYLRRFELGVSYANIIAEIVKFLDKPERRGSSVRPLRDCVLGVDQTGVGRPVVDLLRSARPPCRLHPVTITGGASVTHAEEGWRVPKVALVSTIKLLLQGERLITNPRLPFAKEMSTELTNFQTKVTAAANEIYGTWREGAHDDLVLATAIACWLGERQTPPSTARPFAHGGMAQVFPKTYGGPGGFVI